MSGAKPLGVLVVAVLLPIAAIGADGTDTKPATPDAPMKMDEPMPTHMAKPGMKKGDVKKSAEKKDHEMKAPLNAESASAAQK